MRSRTNMPRGSVHTLWLHSQLLQSNFLGTDPERRIDVYVPHGYDGNGLLLVDLAAFLSGGPMHTGWKAFGENLPDRLDRLIADGTLQGPGLWTFVLGVKYGFAATPETLLYARNLLPPGAVWSAFGIGRSEFPMVAQSWLFGGHVRVGMEDNIFLDKGVLAKSNAELVAKAVHIIRQMGGSVASSLDMRHMLQLAGA